MRTVVSIFLTLLMLISSTGITLGTHYCGGKAVKTAVLLGKGNVSCGMKNMDKPCEKETDLTYNSKKCCENRYDEFHIKDNYKQSKATQSKLNTVFAVAFVVSYFKVFSPVTIVATEYLNYSPPLLKHDLQVMLMSFLI